MSMQINVTFEEVDFWSRCILKTEKGTRLCDIECLAPEAVMANPNVGDWHTMSGPDEEPCNRIASSVVFVLVPEHSKPEGLEKDPA